MSLTIRVCTISEIENSPNIHDLLEEYAAESAIEGLPKPAAKVEMYKHLESVGALHTIGAFFDGLLIGYVTVLTPVLPHYSTVVAVTESFFVLTEYRKTGAGIKLLNAAQEYAKGKKSSGLLVSAPVGGTLAEVLPHIGYTETNRVFFRSLNAH